MTTRLRVAVIVVAWIVLAPIAILVPTAPASAAPPVFDSWSSELDFGQRVSGNEADRVYRALVFAAAAAAAEIDCGSVVWEDAVECGGPGPADAATPAPTPTPIPTATPMPTPTPTPDWGKLEAEALAEAEAKMDAKLTDVSWSMSPKPDEKQIVKLDTYLAVNIDWDAEEETEGDASEHGGTVNVTVSAKPKLSTWTFEELGPRGRPDTIVECDQAGNLWDGSEEPPVCPRLWDHSSDVTGDVKITYQLEYEGTWTSDRPGGGGGTTGPWTIDSTQKETVTVSEVLTYGWSPKNNEDDGGGCGGWWGWACKVAKLALDLALEVVYALAPWVEPFVNFIKGCGDAVIEQLGGLVDIAKEAYAAVTDTDAFIDEKIGLLQDMWEAAKADPDGFIAEVALGFVDADYFEKNGTAAGIGKLLCNLAIDYLSGKAAIALAQKLEKFIGIRRDKHGNICRSSSFPGDTLVLMADGSERRIDTIRPGDHVLSHNLAIGIWETKLVVDQWSHLDDGPAATVRLTDGSEVTATDDHRFWVNNTHEWTQLQWLKAGDQVLTPDGTQTVATVTVGPRHGWTVWELTVADNHNFTVLAGDHPVLVHNCEYREGAASNATDARNHPEVGKGKTAGGGTGNVNGQDLDYRSSSGKHEIDGFVDPPKDPVFDAFQDLDAEYKIMEQAAADIDKILFPDGPRPGPGAVLPEADGIIRIVVDSPPGKVCDSCASVIEQFRERYPNVDIVVEDVIGGAP